MRPAPPEASEVASKTLDETLMANPFQFLQDVRAEGAKITWPSRRETLITTGLVLAMVFVASLFFVSVDQTLRLIVGFLLSLGR